MDQRGQVMKGIEKFTEDLGLYLGVGGGGVGSKRAKEESEHRSGVLWACTVGETGGGGTVQEASTIVTRMRERWWRLDQDVGSGGGDKMMHLSRAGRAG